MISLARARIQHTPLRWRLALWSTLSMFCCLGLCGLALNLYLRYALGASRTESMYKRENRLIRYLNADRRMYPQLSWQLHLDHFLQATPETDLLKISDSQGHRLYPAADPAPALREAAGACRRACVSTQELSGHHVRVLTQTTMIGGQEVRLVLIGLIDEHYTILHVIDVGLLSLLPLVALASVLGGFALSRRALVQVGEMTKQAGQLSLLELHTRIPEPRTGDELQQLAHAWNGMLDRLETSAASITQFTADASHDLRTSMTVILANAQLALHRERNTIYYQETLNTIVRESEQMLAMLEDLLLASRSGWSDGGLQLEKGDLVLLTRVSVAAAQALAQMREQSLELEVTAHQVCATVDRGLISRLFNILLDNAIKYTPRQGRIVVRLSGTPEAWLWQIEDNGIGIAPALHSRIFERLFQVDSTRTGGHGLGLAVARWIAEVHRLKLEVRSEEGQGSTFTIRPAVP